MTFKKVEKNDRIRMSHSSTNLINSCEQKYYYKKIAKTPTDSDVTEDFKAFTIGKVYHEALENCMHERSQFSLDLVYAAAEEHELTNNDEILMVRAMIEKYFQLFEKSGLQVIACEDEIGDENIIGFVDALVKNEDGDWFIMDLKTAARFDPSLLGRLKKDQQLNLYTHFREFFADKYDLPMEKFAGCLYSVTTKCKIKQTKRESEQDYIDRCLERVESYMVFVPADELEPQLAFDTVMEAQGKAMEFLKGGREPKPNYKSCNEYFRSCEWWSQCYGHNHSDMEEHTFAMNTYSAGKIEVKEKDLLDFL